MRWCVSGVMSFFRKIHSPQIDSVCREASSTGPNTVSRFLLAPPIESGVMMWTNGSSAVESA
jgi:hypothetical protein